VGYDPPNRYDPAQHDVHDFASGVDALDRYLERIGAQAQSSGDARVYVVTTDDHRTVVAYYTLSAGSVAYTDAPVRARKGVPERPIPVVVLGRVAVDDRHRQSGLGRALLRDSMLRVLAAAEHVGVRALLVHAKNDDVRDWYLKQAEFEPFPADRATLMLLMKDIRRSLG
jgi:N-acetylglutamate synthase-like GNAT family acetyltransferase